MEMVFLPGGTFEMGTAEEEIAQLQQTYQIKRAGLFTPEAPRHTVYLDAFYIDPYLVTNAQFETFLAAQPQWRPERIPGRFHNGHYLQHWQAGQYPPGQGNQPVVFVSWYAAMAYAQWLDKRLPTEAEWEYAARGGLARRAFPWGDEAPDSGRANYYPSGLGETTAVGSYPPNDYGLYDLAGNVWEYCLDEWQVDYYATSPPANPVAGDALFLGDDFRTVSTRRVIRGGSWGGAPINLRVAYRDSHPPEGAGDHVGFRCVKAAWPPGLR